MLTPTIPITPMMIPMTVNAVLPFPITFMERHIPVPRISAETIPKVYAKIFAGRLTLLSSFLRATTLEVLFFEYSLAIDCA